MFGHVCSEKACKTLHLEELKRGRGTFWGNTKKEEKQREQKREARKYKGFLTEIAKNYQIKGVDGFF